MSDYIIVCFDLLTHGKMIYDIIYQCDDLDKARDFYYSHIDYQKSKGYDLVIYKRQ